MQESITEESILLKITPYDFKALVTYDDENGFAFPDDPDYYFATNYYRRYSNWRCGEPGSKDPDERGICWNLDLYDFTKRIFPKVERKESEKQ